MGEKRALTLSQKKKKVFRSASSVAAVMENDDLDKGRTVVVSGVPDALPLSRMVDKLTIHFQTRRRSRGGDVEAVRYPTNLDGVAFVIFDEAKGKLAGCS